MTNPDNRRGRLYITENTEHSTQRRTTEARSLLYRLIAHFRRDAEETDDPRARTIFEVAVEVISGLVKVFRKYEDMVNEEDNKTNQDQDLDHI